MLPLGGIRYLDSYADGRYHALQVQVEKRYSSGLTAGLSYVYGKSLGVGGDRNSGDPNYQNPRDRAQDFGRYPFDVTHNAVINYVYEMPFLQRFKGLAGVFLGGWQTNGIVTLRTGFPFSVAGGNLNTGPGSNNRPDRIADGRIEDPTRVLYFDPTAFRRTDCNIPGRLDLCHYGNAGAYILNSPGRQDYGPFSVQELEGRSAGRRGPAAVPRRVLQRFQYPALRAAERHRLGEPRLGDSGRSPHGRDP